VVEHPDEVELGSRLRRGAAEIVTGSDQRE